MLEGRWFITGGAGFIARALYLRAREEHWPVTFTGFSRDDAKHAALAHRFPEVTFVRGDVAGDRDFLAAAMAGHDGVLHAAASKYVDLSEMNVFDTVRVNIDGSRNVIEAACRTVTVEQVIGISTDKACGPVNAYGMTKAVMERLFWEAARRYDSPVFKLVRYGNVIGSTGSVIPKFMALAQRGEPIPVTNPDMTRFYMSANEAIDVICAATESGMHSACLIPYNIESMSLIDLVRTATGTVENVVIAGARPGEKVHEQLIGASEMSRAGVHCINGQLLNYLLAPGESSPVPLEVEWDSFAAPRMTPERMRALIDEAAKI